MSPARKVERLREQALRLGDLVTTEPLEQDPLSARGPDDERVTAAARPQRNGAKLGA
ncbi:MAG: hypothetical protein IPJ34_00755 [Myxococcales bacterium]|nr:hypothetical protein [Myxococcales bacterium]